MTQIITARVDDESVKEINFFAKLEKVDKSAEVRRLLGDALQKKRIEYALEKYRNREVSIDKAAELARVPVAEFMQKLSKYGIPFNYSLASLRKDLEAKE